MLVIKGNVGKLLTIKEQYVAGIIFDWTATCESDEDFIVSAEKYCLDAFSPSRGLPLRCELWHGDKKYMGQVQIVNQVVLDCLVNQKIELEGSGQLCQRPRKKIN